jgi:hypothetical protein
VFAPLVAPHAWHVVPEHVSPFMHWSPLFTHVFDCGSQQPDWHLLRTVAQQVPPGAPHAPASDAASAGPSPAASPPLLDASEGASPAASPPLPLPLSAGESAATTSPGASSADGASPTPVSSPLLLPVSPIVTSPPPVSVCVASSPGIVLSSPPLLDESWPLLDPPCPVSTWALASSPPVYG